MAKDQTSHTTIDHDEIRAWAEERGGKPSAVKATEKKGDPGIIRLDFPGYSGGGSLEEISWEDFFAKFEEGKLALVYQKETAGGERSNFNKLIKRPRGLKASPAKKSSTPQKAAAAKKATPAKKPASNKAAKAAAPARPASKAKASPAKKSASTPAKKAPATKAKTTKAPAKSAAAKPVAKKPAAKAKAPARPAAKAPARKGR